MDIFQIERACVHRRIDEVIPQLEDIGVRGSIINEKLHTLRNALQSPEFSGLKIFGSGMDTEDVSDKFGTIKNELDAYAENSSIMIQELTKMLTEIRYT